jgi:dihydroorotate dehydrogenase electron transfer subunit
MTSSDNRQIEFTRGPIVSNEQVAQSTWQIGIRSPELARQFKPGQFAMLRLADRSDAILGRAFAFWDQTFDENGNLDGVQFVYLVKGRMTRPLSTLPPGAMLEVWGPLGNAFSTTKVDHLILVCGGVGQTPMLSAARAAYGHCIYGQPGSSNRYATKVTLVYGARSKDFLAGLPKFYGVEGLDVRLTTEDGTAGRMGRVTDELEILLGERSTTETTRICCCGPEPMMEAVGVMAQKFNVPCEVSLETPMACGIGICFTCVAKINQPDGTWDYRRTCVEGPIFDSQLICWH